MESWLHLIAKLSWRYIIPLLLWQVHATRLRYPAVLQKERQETAACSLGSKYINNTYLKLVLNINGAHFRLFEAPGVEFMGELYLRPESDLATR